MLLVALLCVKCESMMMPVFCQLKTKCAVVGKLILTARLPDCAAACLPDADVSDGGEEDGRKGKRKSSSSKPSSKKKLPVEDK